MSGSYDAFISYRRSDGSAVATWLRRELQAFKPPKSLAPKYPQRLTVYQDSAYERGASDFYEQTIRPALMQSRYLLVVATPDAVRRTKGEDWIAREVADFTGGPFGRNVVIVRGAGEFDGPLPADIAQRFPNIEIVDLRGASRFSFLNPLKAARLFSEKLKLVAPLLSVDPIDMPRLRQEEERRQQRRLGTAAGGTLGVLVSVSALSLYALQSRNAAIRAMEDSMFAAGGMALQASHLAVTDEANTRTRRFIISRGCDLVDKFRQGVTSEPPADEYVMCRVERARQHESLKESKLARAQIDDAVAYAGRQHERLKRLDAAVALVDAQAALGEHLLREYDAAAAETAFVALRETARALTAQHKERPRLIEAQADASEQLAWIFSKRKDAQQAAAAFDEAADATARFIKARADSGVRGPAATPALITRLCGLYRSAAAERIALSDTAGAAERLRKSVAAVRENGGEGAAIALDLAASLAMLSQLPDLPDAPGSAEAAKAEAIAMLQIIKATANVPKPISEKTAALLKMLQGDQSPANEGGP